MGGVRPIWKFPPFYPHAYKRETTRSSLIKTQYLLSVLLFQAHFITMETVIFISLNNSINSSLIKNCNIQENFSYLKDCLNAELSKRTCEKFSLGSEKAWVSLTCTLTAFANMLKRSDRKCFISVWEPRMKSTGEHFKKGDRRSHKAAWEPPELL